MLETAARYYGDDARLHKILEASLDGILVVDCEGYIRYLNKAAAMQLGRSSDNLLGTHFGLPLTVGETAEIDIVLPGGKVGTADVRVVTMEWEGDEAAQLVLLHDLTEYKRTEQALRAAKEAAEAANRSKDQFLATVTHELRTPMNAVIGYTDLLLRDNGLDDKQHNSLQRIQDSGKMLLTLINDILDFSSMELGTLSFDAVAFNLSELVTGTSRMMLGLAKEKGLELKVVMEASLPDTLVGDPDRIRQVLINLIGNAIKFTDQGCVDIKVSPGRRQTDKAIVHLSVTDTGPGIPPLMQERIFEHFTQVDSSTTRRHNGTGLGLAICRQLVEQMGGHIGVNSQPGHHTTFWFTLHLPISGPIVDAQQNTDDVFDSSKPRLTEPGSIASNRNILVVEDNPSNQHLMQELLRKLGYPCDVAASGEEALRALAKRSYGLILMDFRMPDMDGVELTREIRRREGGDDVHLPIIAITADARQQCRETCMKAGMDGYLTKPLILADLENTLSNWFASHDGPS